MKKIINDPNDFVDETIDGILLAFPNHLRASSRDRRAIVRADAPRAGKVGIVIGGGSGHLPVFLGYLGQGLCDGVAIGNVFSSPSSAQVHAATRAVSGGAGVLYMYGNYGGDVYNFDLAADLAAIDGIRVETVLASDDVASAPADRRSSRRGVAGMVFGFKIAGAAAERGDSLDEVTRIARKVADRTRSMGVGLSPTILPAAGEPTFTLADGEMEIGVGIHGEPGVHRGALETADAIADRLVTSILDDLDAPEGSTVAVLVNGAGATPLEELFVLYRRAHAILSARQLVIHNPLVGNYVTSLEMAGASISVLLLDDELTALLDAPASSPFFHSGTGVFHDPTPTAVVDFAEEQADSGAETGEPTALAALLTSVFARLPAHADELRELDAALGDGDLGITVSTGATAAAAVIARHPSSTDAALLQRVGAAFAAANPSTFAALVGGGILYAASRLDPEQPLTASATVEFARKVAARIAERGGAQLGDKTVLDALAPSIDALEKSDGDPAVRLDTMIEVVERVIAETTPLRSARGRAAWLQERSIGLQDPGMTAYLAFLTELRAQL